VGPVEPRTHARVDYRIRRARLGLLIHGGA
jgi:hypothetical protein